MKINIIIVANYFSEALTEISSQANFKIIYRAHIKNKILKASMLFFILTISWLSRLFYGLECSLYIPHSYKRFGSIIKYCCYDNLILIDDGVSFLSAQEFQKKYIFPLIKNKNFKYIIACDDNLLYLQKNMNVNIHSVKRPLVMEKMLKMQNKKSRYLVNSTHMLIIDNGIWSKKEIIDITNCVRKEFGTNIFLSLHPTRKNDVDIGTILDVPVESWWLQNKKYIAGIISSFSTGALNIKSVSNKLEIFFVPPHTKEHLVTIEKVNGKILKVET